MVTGIVDQQAVQKSFANGENGSVPPVEQIYRRVDLQRQTQEGGSWSPWSAFAAERRYRILDNSPEVAPERTSDEFRVDNLVDPVPVLVEGDWKGLDVVRLVPRLRDGKMIDPLVPGRSQCIDTGRPACDDPRAREGLPGSPRCQRSGAGWVAARAMPGGLAVDRMRHRTPKRCTW